MALFDSVSGVFGQAANSLGSNASSAIGAIGSVAGTVSKMAGALNNLSNPAALVSSLRRINLPAGGNLAGAFTGATAQFASSGNDWRVRLSLPTAGGFTESPILQPLVQAGGLVFPYTPSMSIASDATYEDTPLTHQNYNFISYKNSRAATIQITAPFNVEDSIQAAYWLAAVHYMRAVTKMFAGEDDAAGNPPPIVYLNGYGDYVFKNIPVVVKSFSVDLPQGVDYISTNAGQSGSQGGFGLGSAGGGQTVEGIAATTGALAGLAGAVGSAKAAQALGVVSAGLGIANGVKNLLSAAGGGSALGGAASAGASHVPVKSTMNVTLQPIYSRQKIKEFSLKQFVSGAYVDSGYN